MSLITGAGRSGLDPVGKWSLILAPILFIVGGFMTADFGSYHTGLVGDIAANGDTAKLGLTIGIIGVALYARAILGLTRITPEAGNAQARMRVASAGVIALLAIQAVQTGMAMGIAGGDTSGAASFLGISRDYSSLANGNTSCWRPCCWWLGKQVFRLGIARGSRGWADSYYWDWS